MEGQALQCENWLHSELSETMVTSMQALMDGLIQLTATMPEMVKSAVKESRNQEPVSTSTPMTTSHTTPRVRDSTLGWSHRATPGSEGEAHESVFEYLHESDCFRCQNATE